jgi:very-short-patch-repair endonuclease
MPNAEKQHRFHPAILARARELRRPLTPPEQKLWQQLRNKQLHGLKFRRQHPFDRFILDFYCPQRQLVIELDGHHHTEPEQRQYDEARTDWLEAQGLRVVRFSNREVEENLAGVLEIIAQIAGAEEGADAKVVDGGSERTNAGVVSTPTQPSPWQGEGANHPPPLQGGVRGG